MNEKKIIGYTAGVFDLFHIGHLNLLRAARSACDHLIVGVTTDELCQKIKAKSPVIPYAERAQIVASIREVDEVRPQAVIDEIGEWESVGFSRIFKGSDWHGTEKWLSLEQAFATRGVEVMYFPYTETTSSTLLKEVLLALR